MVGQDVCGAAATALRVVRTGTNTLNKTLLPVATAIKHIHPRNVCVCVCVCVCVRACAYASLHTPKTSRSKPKTCMAALSTQSKSETVKMSINSFINCNVLTEQNILQQQKQMNSPLIT